MSRGEGAFPPKTPKSPGGPRPPGLFPFRFGVFQKR